MARVFAFLQLSPVFLLSSVWQYIKRLWNTNWIRGLEQAKPRVHAHEESPGHEDAGGAWHGPG